MTINNMSAVDIDLQDIIISKPRKSNNSYVCHMYYDTKKNKFTWTLKNAWILSVKPLQQRNESFVYFKCKSANNFMYDLNTYVIDVVKEKKPKLVQQ